MFDQPTCGDTPNVIFSRELRDGRSLCDSQELSLESGYGLARALASLSHKQVRALGLTISGISGQRGSTSSASAALQSSLASKLQARLPCDGSILYRLTWKTRATPSGVPICALRASTARTSVSDFTGWPTPNTPSGGGRSVSTEKMDATGRTSDGKKHTASLDHAVKFAGWPTPMAGTPAQNGNNAAGNSDFTRKTMELAGWPTTTAALADKGVMRSKGADLAAVASLTGWATPAARHYRSESATPEFNAERWSHSRGKPLSAESLLSGTPAPMESCARLALNPAHSRWLMGYPATWCEASPNWDGWQDAQAAIAELASRATATPSTQESRPSS